VNSRGQLDAAAVDRRAAGAEVEREVAVAQHGLLGGALVAQPHPDAREKLLEAERLREVVVRPVLEARHLVHDPAARRKDQDRHPLSLRAHRAEHR
jgi:hypothetical protein